MEQSQQGVDISESTNLWKSQLFPPIIIMINGRPNNLACLADDDYDYDYDILINENR